METGKHKMKIKDHIQKWVTKQQRLLTIDEKDVTQTLFQCNEYFKVNLHWELFVSLSVETNKYIYKKSISLNIPNKYT